MVVFKAADVIEMALQIEKNGEVFYKRVAEKIDSPVIKALFEDLAQQEIYHYQTFEKLAQTAWDSPMLTPSDWQDYLGYLDATVQSAFFEGSDKSLALADKVTGTKEAIQMAMGFEKETLLFFHDLQNMVPEGEKATVARIIAEEKTHLRRLASLL
ncbi:MAG: ferritin family protein [Anaerolineales bacterium]|nr:ferritin family protein [Anaerolineales bacterium]